MSFSESVMITILKTQLKVTFTCSKSIIEALDEVVKNVQS